MGSKATKQPKGRQPVRFMSIMVTRQVYRQIGRDLALNPQLTGKGHWVEVMALGQSRGVKLSDLKREAVSEPREGDKVRMVAEVCPEAYRVIALDLADSGGTKGDWIERKAAVN